MSLTEQDILQTLMRCRTRLSAAAWLVLRDTHAAEDVFQNVVLKALTKQVVFETDAALISWALITARRESIDWLRRRQRESVGLDPDILDLLEREWSNTATDKTGSRVEALHECLSTVSESSRQLLKLRYFDGFSCEEIAREMGTALTAIYKRLSRLHESLKQCVEGRLSGLEPNRKESP